MATDRCFPDYAVPPGSVLEVRLEVAGIPHAEFARLCGRSPKLISEIISGKAPLEPGTGLQFEKALAVDVRTWLGIESDYRLHRAREIEAGESVASAQWVETFPVRDLVKRGRSQHPECDAGDVSSGSVGISRKASAFGGADLTNINAFERFALLHDIVGAITVGHFAKPGFAFVRVKLHDSLGERLH